MKNFKDLNKLSKLVRKRWLLLVYPMAIKLYLFDRTGDYSLDFRKCKKVARGKCKNKIKYYSTFLDAKKSIDKRFF